jgi:hypothetical protein
VTIEAFRNTASMIAKALPPLATKGARKQHQRVYQD